VPSADGRCKAFSAAPDCIAWPMAVGMVVVERLSTPASTGTRCWPWWRSARSTRRPSTADPPQRPVPATGPSWPLSLATAVLRPADVDAVPSAANGTGTRLGDPLEVPARMTAYGQDPAGGPAAVSWLGQVLTWAPPRPPWAAVSQEGAGLRTACLPPTLHVYEPSPHSTAAGDVRLAGRAVPWPDGEKPLRSGVRVRDPRTPAHVILEVLPRPGRRAKPPSARPSRAWTPTWCRGWCRPDGGALEGQGSPAGS